jgi:CO dehydrogenase/acetyl-CoA synthase beta subunit
MKTLIAFLLTLLLACVIEKCLFGLILSYVKLPHNIIYYGGWLLIIWIIFKLFNSIKQAIS